MNEKGSDRAALSYLTRTLLQLVVYETRIGAALLIAFPWLSISTRMNCLLPLVWTCWEGHVVFTAKLEKLVHF